MPTPPTSLLYALPLFGVILGLAALAAGRAELVPMIAVGATIAVLLWFAWALIAQD